MTPLVRRRPHSRQRPASPTPARKGRGWAHPRSPSPVAASISYCPPPLRCPLRASGRQPVGPTIERPEYGSACQVTSNAGVVGSMVGAGTSRLLAAPRALAAARNAVAASIAPRCHRSRGRDPAALEHDLAEPRIDAERLADPPGHFGMIPRGRRDERRNVFHGVAAGKQHVRVGDHQICACSHAGRKPLDDRRRRQLHVCTSHDHLGTRLVLHETLETAQLAVRRLAPTAVSDQQDGRTSHRRLPEQLCDRHVALAADRREMYKNRPHMLTRGRDRTKGNDPNARDPVKKRQTPAMVRGLIPASPRINR